MRCVIIINGEISDYGFCANLIESNDYIIAVDGGARHLRKLNVLPNILIGDFDSISSLENYRQLYPKCIIEKYDARKDFTDFELAINKVLALGYKEVIILGAIGERIDHLFANVFLLDKLNAHNVKARIVNFKNIIQLVNDGIDVKGAEGSLVSLIPVTPYIIVKETVGLEYPLKDHRIDFAQSLGISNVIVHKEASITLSLGKALVIQSRD